MNMAERNFRVVGKGVPVKDASEKVSGSLKYAVDLKLQGMAHGKILRSPHPHARIRAIDVSKAEALPGVYGVLTHRDVPQNDWEAAWFNRRGKVLDGTVRFVGDEVAAVAADTEEIAERALSLIDVNYEVLPHVFDIEAAMAPDAPQVRVEGNVRPPYVVEWGDTAEGRAAADIVVECDIRYESQQYAPLGRNACIAEWTGDRVTVWTSSQTPSELRDGIHEALDVPLSKIHVKAMPCGSSFGQWWSVNFMLLTVCLARKARRPVKIELDNEECMSTVKRRHIERTRGRMGCTKDGTLTLAEFDHYIDNGGYGFKDDVGFFCVDMWGRAHHGRYAIRGVNTNLLTAGCMRGVGDCTLGASVERLADTLAEKVGMDPIEFRLKNQIRAGEELRMQHSRSSMKQTMEEYVASIPEELRGEWPRLFHLSSGDTEQILVRGAERFRWKERFVGWGKPHTVRGPLHRAVGVGTGAHVCGVEFEGATSAVVRINPDGSVKVFCSAGRQGQGSETTQSQVAAEALGVRYEDVEIETGDTDACPWSHGSLASNTMYRIGWATRAAALDARRQLLEVAAREFFEGSDPSDLEIVDGIIRRARPAGSNVQVTISQALNAYRSDTLGQTSSITGRPAVPMPPATAFARHFAAHFAEVEVDIETGEIKLLDYLATQDSGTVVNPQVLKNQAIGGAICGAGFAIYEHLAFDPATGAIKNANLLDYKLLRAADFPHQAKVLFADSYDPVGPFGARGAGEAPIAAAISAVSQAVYNAIGVRVDLPMTPERVVRALGRIRDRVDG
jgi:xanthine dehydrogenase molybdenum-binding subunit